MGTAQFGNSSATATTVTLNDTAASVFVVPATSNVSMEFVPPLKVAAGTALTFKAGGAMTTLYAAAQGYVQ